MNVIYTDLDGTLLDFETYSHTLTEPTVQSIQAKGIPVVFCSSKTRAEQEVIRTALQVQGPFITENGSAIFIPKGYFNAIPQLPAGIKQTSTTAYEVIELWKPVEAIRQFLSQIRDKYALNVKYYEDLNVSEVTQITGLPAHEAKAAKTRDYSETLLTGDLKGEDLSLALNEFEKNGFKYVSGGRYITVTGIGSDKGRAVALLNKIFAHQYGKVQSASIGDSANDVPMLDVTDHAYIVQKPDGQWHAQNPTYHCMPGIGPLGFNLAIAHLGWT